MKNQQMQNAAGINKRAAALALCFILTLGCAASACQPVQQVMATPGSALTTSGNATPGNALVSPGDALVSPGDALVSPADALTSPGNALATPGNAVRQEDGSYAVTGTDGNEISIDASLFDRYPSQERIEAVLAAFFAGQDVRYFTFDYTTTRAMYQASIDALELLLSQYEAELAKGEDGHPEQYIESEEEAEAYRAQILAYKAALENAPEDVANIWLDKPLLQYEKSGSLIYEMLDAKAFANDVVFDMYSMRETQNINFSIGIYGRNEMTEEQVEQLRPADGIAWMSMMQGINDAEMSVEDMTACAVAAIEQWIAYDRAIELANVLGYALMEDAVTEVQPTYRVRGVSEGAEDGSAGEREYGWLFTFRVPDMAELGINETITVGVLADGYGQFSWERSIY